MWDAHRGVGGAEAVREVEAPPGGSCRQREPQQVLRWHDVRARQRGEPPGGHGCNVALPKLSLAQDRNTATLPAPSRRSLLVWWGC